MKTIESDLKQKIKALKENPYFDGLEEAILRDLAGHTRLSEFQRGDVMLWEGDVCEGLFILYQGSAKIFRLSPQGRQYIVRILQEGDTFAEVPAFDMGASPVNVEALETCRVWIIEKNKLQELLKQHPAFAQKVLVNFGKMLRGMVRMVSEMAFYQVTHRLARLIDVELHQDKSAHWTQEQLAARLGTVREVVARSLKEMERSGAIKMEDRQIQIVNREIFEQWVQPN
ncbi:MAG: Crp/Fnr family transcriptional regulator [Anaerolineales bacterium]|jgi:CRP-like cAMP-binding protein|nr:Crp/Fnr family transcriptional regulator [Chloroflexota bacterium]MBK6647302.1 Crp/Fnr family transcriptional regulator [Anaerolineales bacterium]MCC6985502.1 Crp/Fnr family transcriptional regulator [Anaerolineales bacterium]